MMGGCHSPRVVVMLVVVALLCGPARGRVAPRFGPLQASRRPATVVLAADDAGAKPTRKAPAKQEIKNWSPMLSTARSIYRRTPMLSAVRAFKPQASVAGAQRTGLRAIAFGATAYASYCTVSEARLEALATPIDGERFALVTGCARALAARGFGVVVVGATDLEARPLARRLRLEYGTRCLALEAPDLETNAAAAVDELRERLDRANVDVDVVVHSTNPSSSVARDAPAASSDDGFALGDDNPHAPPPSGGSSFGWRSRQPNDSNTVVPSSSDGALMYPDDAASLAHQVLEARCASATHLARAFGSGMRRRGRGRCIFVVDGEATTDQFDPSARAAVAASDAYTLALAKTLRRDYSMSGVGVTVARRRRVSVARERLIPDGLFPGRSLDVSPADRLIDAALRGDPVVWFHLDS